MTHCVVICHFIHRTMKEETCIQLLELKVKLSMWQPWRYRGRLEIQLHSFFTLALDGVGWWTSHPSRFTPTHSTYSIHWVGGWVDCKAGMDILENRIVSGNRWELNLRLSSLVSVMIVPPWSPFQWKVTDGYWQQELQDSMKKKVLSVWI